MALELASLLLLAAAAPMVPFSNTGVPGSGLVPGSGDAMVPNNLGIGIALSNASFAAGAAQNTAIGALSVVGGVGTYTFTLTDSASSKVQVAGTNGVNLQVGSASSGAGSFSIAVHADNGAGSTFDRTFLITATGAPPSYALSLYDLADLRNMLML